MADLPATSARSRIWLLTVSLICLLAVVAFYGADIARAMSGGGSCTAAGCHPGMRTSTPINHPDLRCGISGCHDDSIPGLDFYPPDEYLPYGAGNHIGAPCTECHTSSFPAVPQHSTTGTDATHDTTTPFATCSSCHSPALVNEHDKYQPFTCQTCHNSSSTTVQAAIAAGDTSCGACHDVAAAHMGLHDGGASGECLDCHEANISTEHNNACASCHESTDPDVVAAIAANNVQCGACHDLGTAHGDHTVIVVEACADCHGSDVVGIHNGCSACHSTDPAPGSTCTSCHSDIDLSGHGFPIFSGPYNPGYNGGSQFTGYLSWSYVQSQTGAVDSPHGNYSTSTNKCAVCHAVHRADPDGVVLTAWGGAGSATPAFSSTMAPFESCFFCHGNGATFTDKTVEFFVTSTGVLSPHTTCGRCHTASPHGAGTSDYELLASKLLNDHADAQLDVDLRDDNNGLTAAMFDLSDPALIDQGMTLGTGYLCVGCHGNASNEHVFAVNERGATPAIHYTANTPAPGDDAAPGNVTGHQVWVGATSTWSNPSTWYSGGGAHDYYLATYKYTFDDGVERAFKIASATTFNEVTPGTETVIGGPYTTAQIIALYGPWDSEVAFNNAYGCGACHDATRAGGKLAFPHGYVNAAGTPAPKWGGRNETGAIFDGTTLETSFLWMTIAGDADDAKALMTTTGNNGIDANLDGACLKCHLSGDRSEGVGETY